MPQVEIEWNRQFNSKTAFTLSGQLDSLGLGVYVVSDNLFLHVNKSFCSIFEFDSPESFIGHDVRTIMRQMRRPGTGEPIEDQMRSLSGPQRYRYILRTYLGKEILVEEESFPFLYDLRPAFLGVVKNITASVAAPTTEGTTTCRKKGNANPYRHATGSVREKLFELFEWIYDRTGVNLYDYKLESVLRRVERCLISCGCSTYGEYLDHLKNDPAAIRRFLEEFTVNYTEFFRDQEAFDCIRAKVLPSLVSTMAHERSEDEPDKKTWEGMGSPFGPKDFRAWSVGCSSGEEAYSMASLVLSECSGKLLRPIVFATDIDMKKLAVARRGVYPVTKCAPIPKEILAKYFVQKDAGHFAVTEQLRNIIVFGRHDILKDPVYSHMNLILCRNVLIYFNPDRQEELLRSFFWALRPGGYLVLGSSETLFGETARYYVSVKKDLRIYRKVSNKMES